MLMPEAFTNIVAPGPGSKDHMSFKQEGNDYHAERRCINIVKFLDLFDSKNDFSALNMLYII